MAVVDILETEIRLKGAEAYSNEAKKVSNSLTVVDGKLDSVAKKSATAFTPFKVPPVQGAGAAGGTIQGASGEMAGVLGTVGVAGAATVAAIAAVVVGLALVSKEMISFGISALESSKQYQDAIKGLDDARNSVMSRIGGIIAQTVAPNIEEFSRLITDLNNEGVFDGLASSLGDLMDIDFKGLEGFIRASATGLEYFAIAMNGVKRALVGLPFVGPAIAAAMAASAAFNSVTNTPEKQRAAELNKQTAAIEKQNNARKNRLNGDGGDFDMEASVKASGGDFAFKESGSEVKKELQQIRRNTAPLLDLQNAVFGGGQLAAKGISAMDLTPRNRRTYEAGRAMIGAGFNQTLIGQRVG